MKILLILLFSSLFCTFYTHATNDLSHMSPPKMRAVDRDWEYFKSVPCQQLDAIVFHSNSEEILLAKRKLQCSKQQYNKYKAFLPNAVSPSSKGK